MKVDFIRNSYKRNFKSHGKEIMDAIKHCAKNGDFMLQEETRLFEKTLADFIGTKFAVSLNSGTDSLFLSLKALGIGPGDECITVAHTFIASIQAIIHAGAKPVLVDVDQNGLMDMEAVTQCITKKTKAVIPVHFHGKVCDMSKLRSLQDKHKFYIVEDAAQALGATILNKRAGSWGDTGCFSFGFPKLLGAYGDAGGVVTNNEEVYKKLLLLRSHWHIAQAGMNTALYEQPAIMGWGYKSRMDEIQAAVLNVKFKNLPLVISRRREIATHYTEAFRNYPIDLPVFKPGDIVQEYVIQVSDNQSFKEFMEKNGVEVLVRDIIPNHQLLGLGLDHFNLPTTEKLASRSVRLPVYAELTDREVNKVIWTVKKYCQSNVTG